MDACRAGRCAAVVGRVGAHAARRAVCVADLGGVQQRDFAYPAHRLGCDAAGRAARFVPDCTVAVCDCAGQSRCVLGVDGGSDGGSRACKRARCAVDGRATKQVANCAADGLGHALLGLRSGLSPPVAHHPAVGGGAPVSAAVEQRERRRGGLGACGVQPVSAGVRGQSNTCDAADSSPVAVERDVARRRFLPDARRSSSRVGVSVACFAAGRAGVYCGGGAVAGRVVAVGLPISAGGRRRAAHRDSNALLRNNCAPECVPSAQWGASLFLGDAFVPARRRPVDPLCAGLLRHSARAEPPCIEGWHGSRVGSVRDAGASDGVGHSGKFGRRAQRGAADGAWRLLGRMAVSGTASLGRARSSSPRQTAERSGRRAACGRRSRANAAAYRLSCISNLDAINDFQ
jgi:hypothetical protein